MAIKVTNNWNHAVSVSINQWGSGGDTSYANIAVGGSGSWNRTDSRGFVMCVSYGSAHPYYVMAGDEVELRDDKVYANNVELLPLHDIDSNGVLES